MKHVWTDKRENVKVQVKDFCFFRPAGLQKLIASEDFSIGNW